MIFVLGMTLLGLIGCSIRTPEIQGIVLDEKTKQPVEGAWVRATLDLKSKTIQGDVTSYLSVDSPHTRTDKHGKFLIPSKSFKKPPFPIGFGTKAINFGIGAATIDDRGGRINLKGEELEKFLGKKKVELTIYSGPVERTEAEYSSHLQSLYKYCLTGRSSVEVRPTEGGCDEWELNYAIAKHERYLEGHKDPEIIVNPPYGVSKFDKIIQYSGAIQQLAGLYEKKGNLGRAVHLLREAEAFDKKHGLSSHLRKYETQINELQKKLQKSEK
jgi:hypothetical protein